MLFYVIKLNSPLLYLLSVSGYVCSARRQEIERRPGPPPPFPSSPSCVLRGLPLEVVALKCSQGVWGSTVSSPSGVWNRAPADIKFGCILALKSDVYVNKILLT